MTQPELFISVDVETAGPNPGSYAMLSIGACALQESVREFYIELKPDKEAFLPEALAISKLDMKELAKNGEPPEAAMRSFAEWITEVIPLDHQPVFVAFNAPFDWMFVADYFHRYLGYNPFGHKALDIKAYFMGAHSIPWNETSFSKATQLYGIDHPLSHNALQDARDQAELFKKMLRGE